MLALRLLPMYRASAARLRFASAPEAKLRSLATAAACSAVVLPKLTLPNGVAPAAFVARYCCASGLIVEGTKQKGLLASALVLGGVQLLGVVSSILPSRELSKDGRASASASQHVSKREREHILSAKW